MKKINKNISSGARIRKCSTRDEFYTTEETAQRLFVNIDKEEFNGKIVYCNCDFEWSEIYKYLKERFSELKLKKLIATGYNRNDGKGQKTTFDGNEEVQTLLEGDGDYRSEECLEISRECDIIATNPPFSLLDDFIPRFLDMGKDIVVIANLMAIGHKPFWKYLTSKAININQRMSGSSGEFKFSEEDTLGKLHTKTTYVNCCGLTTLKNIQLPSLRVPKKTFAELERLGKIHHPENLPDKVEVKYLSDIPIDYDGIILTPISAALIPWVKERYDVLKFCDYPVVVDGKSRFYRVEIKRKEKTTT